MSLTAKQYGRENKEFKYWRMRTMYSIMIGYGAFYMVRQNLSYAVPSMCSELGISKSDIGFVMSIGAILYGLGKFIFGLVGDRYSARYVMAIGLFASGLMNIFLGMSSLLPLIVLFFALNQCFQSMGAPPCAKMLANWFGKSEQGSKWSIWNTSLHVGGAIAGFISPWLLEYSGWRMVFYFPGVIAILTSFFVFNRLRDTPKNLGFPSVDEIEGTEPKIKVKNSLGFIETAKLILANKFVWILGFANMFIYINRMTFINWGPTMLQEARGSSSFLSGNTMALFDLSGIIGSVIVGYLSDKFFRNKRAVPAMLCMICVVLLNVLFLSIPKDSIILNLLCMSGLGAFMTAPIVLINALLAGHIDGKAVATAIGFSGTMGYFGTALAGIGTARIAEAFGWNSVVIFTMSSAFIASILFWLVSYKQTHIK